MKLNVSERKYFEVTLLIQVESDVGQRLVEGLADSLAETARSGAVVLNARVTGVEELYLTDYPSLA